MNTVSPSIGATPEERHRRRIALVGHLAWPLLALLFPVFFFWLFLRLISCAGDVPLRVCEWGFVAPLILGAAIIFCLGVAVWSLFQYDRLFALTDALQKYDWARPRKVAAHARGISSQRWKRSSGAMRKKIKPKTPP